MRLLVNRRLGSGKEHPERWPERFGTAGLPRPQGRLVWIHAASVGEANSVLVLIDQLLALAPDARVLMTTGTVTSAELMARRLPERAFHQFIPVDLPAAVDRFLTHWHPDLVLWTESEIWPNMLGGIRHRNIPAALINARMSERSGRRWGHVSGFIASLLGSFQVILAQTDKDADRLRGLGGHGVVSVGNLKFSANPPPAAASALADLQEAVAGRPVWLLASAHPGEEEIAVEAHARLIRAWPDLLTILLPRHPVRGPEWEQALTARGLAVSRRADGRLPARGDAVHIADTIGETGLFYRLAPVVCMGGSFIKWGGQNPVEPAQLGCAVLYGPHMSNFSEITQRLEQAGGARPVRDVAALATAVDELLGDPVIRGQLIAGATRVTEDNRRIVERALIALTPVLTRAGLPAPGPSA